MGTAGTYPAPGDRLGRTSRATGVEILYTCRSGRVRPATTRSSSPRWSPAGFAAWPTGALRWTPEPLLDLTKTSQLDWLMAAVSAAAIPLH